MRERFLATATDAAAGLLHQVRGRQRMPLLRRKATIGRSSLAPARAGSRRKDVAMASLQHEKKRLQPEDRKLVDLLGDVLVDPNVHTDTRLRLHREIAEILRGAHVDLHGPAGNEVYARALEAHGGRLPDLLATVLVDPNLHTDTRMRLHKQIAHILDSAAAHAQP
jgi:hypothetical protein